MLNLYENVLFDKKKEDSSWRQKTDVDRRQNISF